MSENQATEWPWTVVDVCRTGFVGRHTKECREAWFPMSLVRYVDVRFVALGAMFAVVRGTPRFSHATWSADDIARAQRAAAEIAHRTTLGGRERSDE